MRIAWLLALTVCACASPAASPETLSSASSQGLATHWRRVVLADSGLSIETPGDRDPEHDPNENDTVLNDRIPHVAFSVFVGKGVSLASWQAHGHSAPGTAVSGQATICNETVETFVASQPAQTVEVFGPSNHHEGLAGSTTVTVAFTHAGVGVIAQWAVDTDQREALRAAEERFFASIRCP